MRVFYEATVWRRSTGLFAQLTTTLSGRPDHWSTPIFKLAATTVEEAARELSHTVGVLNADVRSENCTLVVL